MPDMYNSISGILFMAISIDINDQILENQKHALQACMTVDSEMGKRLRELIFQELKRVRYDIAGGLKFANGDPRGTRGAVKRYIASKYLGGIVSIMDGKTSGNRNSYEAPRKLRPGQRGGNRMLRSQRTDDNLHYGPDERIQKKIQSQAEKETQRLSRNNGKTYIMFKILPEFG